MLPEPFDTAFCAVASSMALGARSSSGGRGCTTAEYADFCKKNPQVIVDRMGEIIGRDSNGVKAVRIADRVPRQYDGADLYLEVYIEGVPDASQYYALTCQIGESSAVIVELNQG